MKTNIVIPMAGLGKRFSDAGYTVPKPFLPMHEGETMIEAVVSNLGRSHNFCYTFVVNGLQIDTRELSAKLDRQFIDYQIKEITYVPYGPAHSAWLAKNLIDAELPLIITNCDQIIEDFNIYAFNEFCKVKEADGVIGVFHSCSPKNSYIELGEDNKVIRVKEKEVISRIATNGFHWWKRGSYFIDSVELMSNYKDTVNNEYYVAPSYNYMLQKGMKVLPYWFNLHYPIGTPEDYEAYRKLKGL